MTKMAINKIIGLAIILILTNLFSFSQDHTLNKTSCEYIIQAIEPRSAVITINGRVCKLGSKFKGSEADAIDIPNNAAIRVKELSTQKHSVIKGGKQKEVQDQTLSYYKQLNSKGTINIESIRNYLNREKWLMISDTVFIDFPSDLDPNQYLVFKSIPKFLELRPTFNYTNNEIMIKKSDLVNAGIYNENDSIIQFQVEVHDSENSNSLFVTDLLKIVYFSSK